MIKMRFVRTRTFVAPKRIAIYLALVVTLLLVVFRRNPRGSRGYGRSIRWGRPLNAPHTVSSRAHRDTKAKAGAKSLRPNDGRPDLARRFALLLAAWRSAGGAPNSTLLELAGSVGPGVAVEAVLHDVMHRGAGSDVVVDVGANGGYPTTVAALKKHTRFVLAIDPDARNVRALRRVQGRFRAADTRMAVVNGAAGSASEVMRMAFHKSRTDFSCFRCLNPKKADVFTADVQVKPVDTLLAEHNIGPDRDISLLKTDTQGHEAKVLEGSKRAFARRKIAAVLVEFDPRLLGRKETAIHVLSLLDGHGMKCIHLKFSVPGGSKKGAPFSPQPIRAASADSFYKFAVARGGWTDLLCLRI